MMTTRPGKIGARRHARVDEARGARERVRKRRHVALHPKRIAEPIVDPFVRRNAGEPATRFLTVHQLRESVGEDEATVAVTGENENALRVAPVLGLGLSARTSSAVSASTSTPVAFRYTCGRRSKAISPPGA